MPRPHARRAAARALAVASIAAAVAAPTASLGAQIAAGSRLSFTGTADARDLGTPGVRLDFVPTVQIAASGNTGAFKQLDDKKGRTTGVMQDLVVGQGPQAIPGLLTVGGYTFNLTALPSGPFGQADCYVYPAPGQTCTPYQSALGQPLPTDALSPFYLTNLPSGDATSPIAGAVVAFNLAGTVTGPKGATSNFVGTVATFFPGYSYQEVLGGLEETSADGGSLFGVSFFGTFVTTGSAWLASSAAADAFADDAIVSPTETVTPEPGSVALAGIGLLGVAAAARRRRERRA